MDLCYEALNGSCWKYTRPSSVQVPMLITMTLTTFVTIIGNLVIISIGHFKQLHMNMPTNQLILSLALCDFLLGLFVMPLSAVHSWQGCWYFGDFMCKIHTCIDINLSTASIFHLVCVCRPLKYHSCIGLPTVPFMISISWLIPAVFTYTMTFCELNLLGARGFYETHVYCAGGCHVLFSHGSAVIASMISFYVPGLIIIGIYYRIYMVARNQARSINLLFNQLRRVYPSRDAQHRARRATITVAIMVGVFLFCWTPFFLRNIMDPFIGYTIPSVVIDALVWFGYVNSTLNPFIYALYPYSWFRKAVRLIINEKIFQNNSSRKRLYP
ncbi:LOW QUALITY PROTEIN: trace amine-associated receptor 1b [Myxocyprinus asiaticus]|uniref:LOW QUALITY PROTEIN: trace amine-associated receptor 1b n=1 Tax=Myxocyprinus asiaticus TaxID=70543 RepID=UPI002223B438|nr:LOW QUALITY PROTEIN: trace amine-associated receptor 1b [Myxocyprinus asiaticus]